MDNNRITLLNGMIFKNPEQEGVLSFRLLDDTERNHSKIFSYKTLFVNLDGDEEYKPFHSVNYYDVLLVKLNGGKEFSCVIIIGTEITHESFIFGAIVCVDDNKITDKTE